MASSCTIENVGAATTAAPGKASNDAPAGDRVSPAQLSRALAEISSTIERTQPGAMGRMTAGDFVAAVLASFSVMGELPRRMRVTPLTAPTVSYVAPATYATVLQSSGPRPMPTPGVAAPVRKAHRKSTAKPRSSSSKEVEIKRRRVLNAAMNSYKRTKNPDRRSLYTKYVKSVAHLKEFVAKMTAEQLNSMPRGLSALLGCGIIPLDQVSRDWYDSVVVDEAKAIQASRQVGGATTAARVDKTQPAEPSKTTTKSSTSSQVEVKPKKQKVLPPPKERRAAYKRSVTPEESEPPSRSQVGRKEKKTPQTAPVSKIIELAERKVSVARITNVARVVNPRIVSGIPRLHSNTLGWAAKEAASALLGHQLCKTIKGELGEKSPIGMVLSPDEILVMFSIKPDAHIIELSARPILVKEAPPRIKLAASLLTNSVDLSGKEGSTPLGLRVAVSPSVALLKNYLGEASRKGWTPIASLPKSFVTSEKEVQSRFEPKVNRHIGYEPCSEES